MMDCKRALVEADGDIEAATTALRKKGLADAAKRAGRSANEGLIHSYIHNDRVGVLVEVNTETDFVARNDEFRAFVHDLALHIAAMRPMWVSADDVPDEYKDSERAIYAEQAKDVPEQAREKAIEGKLAKQLRQVVLFCPSHNRNSFLRTRRPRSCLQRQGYGLPIGRGTSGHG